MSSKNLIRLSEAAKLTPNRVSVNCVWRWARKGIIARNGERVHLWHVRCGGTIHTTRTALEDFYREIADADAEYFADAPFETPPPVKSRTASRRERDIERAELELENAGL